MDAPGLDYACTGLLIDRHRACILHAQGLYFACTEPAVCGAHGMYHACTKLVLNMRGACVVHVQDSMRGSCIMHAMHVQGCIMHVWGSILDARGCTIHAQAF